jgi:hypothetical protein
MGAPSGAKFVTGSPTGNTLRCRQRLDFGLDVSKHERGGVGKPIPLLTEEVPQRGKRQEGMASIGDPSVDAASRRDKAFEAANTGSVWCPTAWEEAGAETSPDL